MTRKDTKNMLKNMPPTAPIPTAFNSCISVEEQLCWIAQFLITLRQDMEDAGVIQKKEETL